MEGYTSDLMDQISCLLSERYFNLSIYERPDKVLYFKLQHDYRVAFMVLYNYDDLNETRHTLPPNCSFLSIESQYQ